MRRVAQTVFITILCVVSTYQDNCTITNNGDISLSDLEAHHGQPKGACCKICENTVGCRGFAWNESENGTCLLKGGPEIQTNGTNEVEGRSSIGRLTEKCYNGKPGSASTRASYVDTAVQEHNKYRSRHSSPKVTAASVLNKYAQKWADHLASSGEFYHSNGPYGENIYMGYGSDTDKNKVMVKAIASFYSEIKNYDWNKPGFSMDTGHFTQVVWKASTEIGVGISTYPDPKYKYRTVVCISYRPPGNYAGEFEKNVLPPKTRNIASSLLNEEKPGEEPFESMVL